ITSCLRLNRVDVPNIVTKGSSISLHCDFDLESASLYSVKWYKNNVEFYRFMILGINQKAEHKYFAQPGISVEMNASNITHVHLKDVDLNSEGLYECEVSTDAPSFQTIRGGKHLKIYAFLTLL
ncbi:cell adhesion molecule 2-like protein, partial [Leptotrombidium deliense]